MGQAASLESRKRRKPYRARANTMKATPPPLAAFRETRPSLPEYTLTQYEVKQLMKSFHEAMQRGDTRTTSSAESEAEDELMEQIHGQFGPQPRTRSMIRSTTSNASEDSGIDENGHSPRHSLDDLTSLPVFARTIGDDTPMALTPATPVVISMLNFTPPAEQIDLDKYINPQPKRRRFIPKRLFGKKKVRASQRQRSKSLGSYDALSAKGDRPAPLFGSSLLNREWELVTVREMCRRLSLDEIEQLEMPIPEGASQSQILDELMIRQIMEILPPRAEGYPWVSIYNSEKHGFSLTTLYRKMIEFDEDLSPVLLIVRDTREHVFGAVVSGAIRPCDHYTGTGDSCLLWRFLGEAPHTRDLRHFNWTGENQFFVNAAKDSLSIGAGGGHYGLWLDADLNHGRSQRCDTFDNEPLSGDKEDFIVQFIEAFGFRM